MSDFLKQLWLGGQWALTNREEIIAAVAALVAGMSAFIKALQTFVDFFAHHFPSLAKADTPLGQVLKFLAWLSHLRILNTVAMNSKPSHAIQLGNSLPDTSLPRQAAKTIATVAMPLLLLSMLVMPTGCAHVPALVTDLVDCGEQGLMSQVGGLTSQVAAILGGNSPNWQDGLDALEAASGDAVGCAVQVVVNQLEHSANRGTVSEVALVRGETWVRAQPKIYRTP